MRTVLSLLALSSLLAAPAVAQPRRAAPVQELHDGILGSQLHAQRSAVERCAGAVDSGAFLVEVRARVARGARPSSMHNARISVNVRSRPRDHRFEACVRRHVRDTLRNAPYGVERPARAHVTFRLNERPDPHPEPPPARPYSAAEVRRVLRRSDARLSRCLGIAGVPEQVTLRVAVDADGRLMLTSANVPGGAAREAVPCMHRVVENLRVRGAPARRVELTHTVAVRRRAY